MCVWSSKGVGLYAWKFVCVTCRLNKPSASFVPDVTSAERVDGIQEQSLHQSRDWLHQGVSLTLPSAERGGGGGGNIAPIM